jgi:DNA invertase Pin-like site-specific DNA recombinase
LRTRLGTGAPSRRADKQAYKINSAEITEPASARAALHGEPMSRMALTVLGRVAEMELGFIRDRQRAGIDAAKAKGIRAAWPLSTARIVSLRKGGMGVTEIAKAVGRKRGNVYKTLKPAGLN